MRRLAVLALFVGVACTGSSGASSSSAPPVPASSPSMSPVAVDGDRLLVVRDDGNLETIDPNGGGVLALTTDAGPDVLVDQPVSSPDGRSIAWVELRSDGPRVVTTSRAGGNRREIPLTVAPFFLAWDPTSMRIAYLGNAGAGIGLGVIDNAVVQPRDVPVGGGAPLYLAWSPDGAQLLVHVGADGLGRTDLSHPLRPAADTPGTFQAPAWLPDGRELYVARQGADQTLVVIDHGDRTVLRRFRGGALFEPSPDGARVAYRLDALDGTDTGVYVQDLSGGPATRVTRADTLAFFWSPAGDRLLLLTGDPNGGPFRWRVWQGHERFVGDTFVPSPTFLRDYLPFFDQYAQTITPWAPDGSAFAYAGLHEGESGIWVQPLAGRRRLIGDGAFVTWTPTPDG
jgi:TolB protein